MHREPTNRGTGSDGEGGESLIPDHVPEDLRDVEFPIGLRGYERRAVDDYVVEVNRVIAELEATRTPESVVKRALDRVGEETAGILQRARETADEITARSRSQADDRLEQAGREAQAVKDEAQARARKLEHEMNALMEERSRLVAEVRLVAQRLLEVAEAAETEAESYEEGAADRVHETQEIDAVPGARHEPGERADSEAGRPATPGSFSTTQDRPPEEPPEYRPE